MNCRFRGTTDAARNTSGLSRLVGGGASSSSKPGRRLHHRRATRAGLRPTQHSPGGSHGHPEKPGRRCSQPNPNSSGMRRTARLRFRGPTLRGILKDYTIHVRSIFHLIKLGCPIKHFRGFIASSSFLLYFILFSHMCRSSPSYRLKKLH